METDINVMVAGAGISGICATNLLLDSGMKVLLYDQNENLNIDDISTKLFEPSSVVFKIGQLDRQDIKGIGHCIISPGISLETEFVQMLLASGVQIYSEIELGYKASKGKLFAITGTNGKTTTTSLLGEIVRSVNQETFVVGNIGLPYTSMALHTTENSATVLEVSSFQLETIVDFRPHVCSILNITQDHLNRHHTMANYTKIKESITKNQTQDDYCILNYDCEVLRAFASDRNLKSKVVFFSSTQMLEDGYFLDGDYICRVVSGIVKTLLNVNELELLGRHNYENVMAAIAMAECAGIPMERILEVCRHFKAVEHRIEFVRERLGVRYYNDSKGTNPDAALQAVRAMRGPILLIGGGYDKQGSFDEWVESFHGRVKQLVLIGQTRERIAECAKKHGFTNIINAEDMEEAVKVCASYAQSGDVCLLSPACASWDMFTNYEQRGRVFKECVMNL